MALSPIERAKVWNSLDPNLREQVRSGAMSIEEAATYVVGIGDLEQERARLSGPGRSLDAVEYEPGQQAPVAGAAPTGEYGVGTMLDVDRLNRGAFVEGVAASWDAANMDATTKVMQYADTPFLDIVKEERRLGAQDYPNMADRAKQIGPTYAALERGARVLENIGSGVVTGLTAKLQQAKGITNEENMEQLLASTNSLMENKALLENTAAELAKLPQNPYTNAFITGVNEGDYLKAARNAPMAGISVMGEQAGTMAMQAATVMATYAATRNKKLTRGAAMAAGGLGGMTELGSDILSVWNEVPLEERTLDRFKEALATAQSAATARTVIEAAMPGIGAQIGKTAMQRTAMELGAQAAGGMAAEAVASGIKGQDLSMGELLLEGIADSAGAVVEAGPSLREANISDTLNTDLQLQANEAFDQQFAARLKATTDQQIGERNRATFDAEAEADQAIRDLQGAEALARGEQLELPIGSDMAADPLANDRTPTIVDMFSNEPMAATRAETQRAGNVAEAQSLANGTPNLTDEEFEVRSQRQQGVRRTQERNQQTAFEDTKAQEEIARAEGAEDRTVLKNERQLLSTTDINREAKRLLDVEREGIRQTRRGIARTPEQMDSMLKAYDRKRLPELVEVVRKRRTDRVNQARTRDIARENEALKAEAPSVEEAASRFTTAPKLPPVFAPNAPRPVNSSMADLLPENQAGALNRVTSVGTEASPPLATPQQTSMELVTQPEEQGDMFTNAGATGFTGELGPDQLQAELRAGQERRRAQNATRAPQAVAGEPPVPQGMRRVYHSGVPSSGRTDPLNRRWVSTDRTYAKNYRSGLPLQYLDIPANDTRINNADYPEQGSSETFNFELSPEESAKLRAIEPAAAPAATPEEKARQTLTEKLRVQAETIVKKNEAASKAKETKSQNRQIKAEIAKGATPEEAAETVANRILAPQEDADLRRELGVTPEADKSILVMVDRDDGGQPYLEDSDLRDALDAELAKDTPDITKVLDAIVNDRGATKAEKWLAAKLIPLAKRLGVKLVPMDTSPKYINTAGAYVNKDNAVWIRSANRETVLHEVLHAVTSNVIMSRIAKTNPTVKAAVQKLEDALAFAKAHVADGNPLPDTITAKRWAAATVNIKELLAHTMTEQAFIEFLSDIPMPGTKKSVWQYFKEAIMSLFSPRNPSQYSILDAVIEATGELIEFNEANPKVAELANAEIRDRQTAVQDLAGIEEDADLSSIPSPDGDPILVNRSFSVGGKLRPEWKDTPAEAIWDGLTAGGGSVRGNTGRSVITEIFERSASETGAYIFRADQLFKQMDYALNTQAYKQKKDPSAYRDTFKADVEKFEQSNGITKVQQAKYLNDTYGKAASAYFDARRTIDNLSNEILQQRLDDPRPFTEAEAKIFRSIKENLGKYYTRVYAANTRNIGSLRAKKLWKEWDSIRKGSTEKSYRDGHDIVQNAIRFVADNHLVIPDDLDSMNMQQLTLLARSWGVDNRPGADLDNVPDTAGRREALITGLEEMREMTSKDRMQQAKVLVEDLLFAKEKGALVSYYGGQSQDKTIVTERTVVPEAIRKLLGEYEDLPLKAMTTIIRMASFRSKAKAFAELLAREKGNTVLTSKELRERGLSPQDWTHLTSDTYGPLQNMWVRKDVALRLEDTVEITRTFEQMLAMNERGARDIVKTAVSEGANAWMTAAGWIKGAQLVWNVSNAGLNWGGGLVALLSNGNVDPATVKDAHKIALDFVRAQSSGTLTPEMERIVRAGITDSALLGDIRKVEAQKLDEVLFSHLRTPLEKVGTTGRARLADAGRTWRETYAMADVVWKIANFLNEEKRLAAFYKANGDDVSAEQIEREAAWNTNNSNFSYKRVPNIIKAIEKGGIAYVLPYIYETFRAPVGSVLVGISDLQKAKNAKTPKAKALALRSGSARLLGASLAMGAVQMAAYTAAKALMGQDEEDDEWVRSLKTLLPEHKKFADFLYLGRNEDNEPVVLEFSRIDPFGPATEFYRMAAQGAEPEEYLEATKNLLFVNPYATGVVQSFFGQKPAGGGRLQAIDPEAYDTMIQLIGERGAKAVDRIMPSALMRPIDPNNKAPVDNPLAELYTMLGGQLHNVDTQRAVEFATYDYKDAKEEVQEDLYSMLKYRTNLTEREILEELVDLKEKEAEAFERLHDTSTAMSGLGYPPAAFAAMAKSSPASLSDQEIILSMIGYKPEHSQLISERGLETSLTQALTRSGEPGPKQLYLDNVRRLVKLISEGKVQTKE